MQLDEKKRSEKSKKPLGTIVLYAAGTLVAFIGAASLINNVILYLNSVALYVAQGFPRADVVEQLLPSQLLPGVFEPIAVYGGIALVLFYIGIINNKVSKCLTWLDRVEARNDLAENALNDLVIEDNELEATEQTENIDPNNEAAEIIPSN